METYISRKLVLYKAKHEQLCALGVVPESRQACFWDSIAVSPIEGASAIFSASTTLFDGSSAEFGLLWSMYGKTPPDTLEANVNRLAALTPVIDLEAAARPSPPASLSSASTGSSSTRHPNGIPHRATSLTEGATAGKTRLFLVDELAVRDVVVGIQLSSLGRFVAARSILRRVVEGESAVHSDTFIVAHALAEMAVIELREGEEVAGRMKDKDEAELAKLWKDRTAEASRWIEAAFARGAEHYNMRCVPSSPSSAALAWRSSAHPGRASSSSSGSCARRFRTARRCSASPDVRCGRPGRKTNGVYMNRNR